MQGLSMQPTDAHHCQPGFFGIVTKIAKDVLNSSKQMIAESTAPIIANIASATFSYVMRDSAMSKIVGGVGCTLGGGYMVLKSGVHRILKAKFFGVTNQERTVKPTTTRIITAVTGAAFMTYGVLSVASGVMELWHRFRDNSQDLKRIESLSEKLQKCPAAHALWKEIENEAPFSIKLTDDTEIVGATWTPASRTIGISRKLNPDMQLRMTLFEMCNARQNQNFLNILSRGINGEFSSDEYLKEMIHQEWHSATRHHQIAVKCIKSQGWQPVVDIYRFDFPLWNNFEAMYEDYLQDPREAYHHAQYKEQWQTGMKEAYCKRHQLATECN